MCVDATTDSDEVRPFLLMIHAQITKLLPVQVTSQVRGGTYLLDRHLCSIF